MVIWHDSRQVDVSRQVVKWEREKEREIEREREGKGDGEKIGKRKSEREGWWEHR